MLAYFQHFPDDSHIILQIDKGESIFDLLRYDFVTGTVDTLLTGRQDMRDLQPSFDRKFLTFRTSLHHRAVQGIDLITLKEAPYLILPGLFSAITDVVPDPVLSMTCRNVTLLPSLVWIAITVRR